LTEIHRTVALDQPAETVTVRVTRDYDAEAEDIWDAITNPERLPRWFMPISGDLRVGGSFQLEGNAGGEIRDCNRPTFLRVTFGGPESIVEVTLSDSVGRTSLELVHRVPQAMAGSVAGALWVGPGWDGALLGLGQHLAGVEIGDPREIANSPEVIEFNRGSIEQWTAAIESAESATTEEIAAAREAALAQYTTIPS
jgi:uncharacterized protein YndB with AHSA1/START domain